MQRIWRIVELDSYLSIFFSFFFSEVCIFKISIRGKNWMEPRDTRVYIYIKIYTIVGNNKLRSQRKSHATISSPPLSNFPFSSTFLTSSSAFNHPLWAKELKTSSSSLYNNPATVSIISKLWQFLFYFILQSLPSDRKNIQPLPFPSRIKTMPTSSLPSLFLSTSVPSIFHEHSKKKKNIYISRNYTNKHGDRDRTFVSVEV